MTSSETITAASDQRITVSAAHDQETNTSYKYAAYLPVYDETTKLRATEPFEFKDRGLDGDKDKKNLLGQASLLSALNDAQKKDLALLLAERGVVVFRGQDFKDIGPEKQKEFASFFGRLHIHPVGAHPPGITLLCLLKVPSSGGDTAWVSQAAAYERLSEPVQKLIEGLRAEHSGFPQAENARRDGKFVRREPVKSDHPIVRFSGQVTGQKVLFVNPGFAKRIVGLKDEESDAILQLLFKPIFRCELYGTTTTMTLWDNRVTAHTAISHYDVHNPAEGLRHGIRLTTLGEKPQGINGLDCR
ncbi:hypothetical protein EPUS_01808 [Endocarpon pusillum Z07020]|uniref:TauD/TfdA-like domain-containing protein n=1 Tax=Endocarpon pusillum (strain Z07020 / HMAS-L-300199) TaxID=1263415 RepID=U1GID8_ENDPU|nr:uncharacterized protein EPUS_01808 [Endocarpon pusillum Z07020]ERF71893.1 hypothetical protein EPUS_01808 [Endocarpon pusillum Z07020]